jgi:hypothetical protein
MHNSSKHFFDTDRFMEAFCIFIKYKDESLRSVSIADIESPVKKSQTRAAGERSKFIQSGKFKQSMATKTEILKDLTS